MKIRYIGGRVYYKVTLNRNPYFFIPENNMILEITDQNVINYIFSLPNRQEFQAVESEPVPIAEPEPVVEIKPEDQRKVLPEVLSKSVFKKFDKPKKGVR